LQGELLEEFEIKRPMLVTSYICDLGVLGHGNILPKFKKLWEVIGVLGSIVRHIKGTRKHI
jgi:hypothetical protein